LGMAAVSLMVCSFSSSACSSLAPSPAMAAEG
jgi:hypothetical protein